MRCSKATSPGLVPMPRTVPLRIRLMLMLTLSPFSPGTLEADAICLGRARLLLSRERQLRIRHLRSSRPLLYRLSTRRSGITMLGEAPRPRARRSSQNKLEYNGCGHLEGA